VPSQKWSSRYTCSACKAAETLVPIKKKPSDSGTLIWDLDDISGRT